MIVWGCCSSKLIVVETKQTTNNQVIALITNPSHEPHLDLTTTKTNQNATRSN